MLSSHRLWPRSWSVWVAFISSPPVTGAQGKEMETGSCASADGGVDESLCFAEQGLQMRRALEALRIDLVDVLGARRPGREPTVRGRDLQAADAGVVAGRP